MIARIRWKPLFRQEHAARFRFVGGDWFAIRLDAATSLGMSAPDFLCLAPPEGGPYRKVRNMRSRFARGLGLGVVAGLGMAGMAAAQDFPFGPPTAYEKSKPKKKPAAPAPTAAAESPAPAAAPTPPKSAPAAKPAATAAAPAAAAAGAAKAKTPAAPASGFDEATFKPAPPTCRNTEPFEPWLSRLRQEAAAEGIAQSAIATVLDGMTVDPGVISRDRKQGIFSISFLEFSQKLANNNRIQSGKAQVAKHKATFERASKQFGVPASVITGFWALESDFGAGMGNLPILRSIVTLAYDCRRGPLFREEVKAAMRIVERGDMSPSEMVGSWAGEIGQTQFLPSRYLKHAIDYDGDGKADLFRNPTDIIGTTANYMSHLGWKPNEPWLEEVRVPADMPWQEADLAIKHPRSNWAKWGVTRADGSPLAKDAVPASLLLPMGRFGPAFLAYENFGIYLKWNQSLNYATTAAWLATRIDGAGPMNKGNGAITVLGPEDAKELQRQLVKRGFDVGEIDGRIGSATRAAVKQMQIKYKMPADSFPTQELLAALKGGA